MPGRAKHKEGKPSSWVLAMAARGELPLEEEVSGGRLSEEVPEAAPRGRVFREGNSTEALY